MPATRMNSLKSLAMNWGPLSLMMRGVTPGNFSLAQLENGFDVDFLHFLADFKVDEEAAIAIENPT